MSGKGLTGDTQAAGLQGSSSLREPAAGLFQGIRWGLGMRGGGLLKYFYFLPC